MYQLSIAFDRMEDKLFVLAAIMTLLLILIILILIIAVVVVVVVVAVVAVIAFDVNLVISFFLYI